MKRFVHSIIPMAIIYVIYNEVLEYIVTKFSMLTKLLSFVPVETIFMNLLPIALIMGAGIGFLGSITTVRKHLKV